MTLLVEKFRKRSDSATGIFYPTWSREIFSVVSHSLSTFSILFYQKDPSSSFFLQQRRVEAELQVFFRHFNALAVTNSGSDTFPSSCFSWTSRDHCHHPTLLPAFTCGFSSSGSPEEFSFPFLSLVNCVCSQLHGMSKLQWSHIPPFQSLLDLVLMLDSTHNIFYFIFSPWIFFLSVTEGREGLFRLQLPMKTLRIESLPQDPPC